MTEPDDDKPAGASGGAPPPRGLCLKLASPALARAGASKFGRDPARRAQRAPSPSPAGRTARVACLPTRR